MPKKGNVTRPRIEPMLMIRPSRFSRMEGSTARVTRRSPMTFVSKTTDASEMTQVRWAPPYSLHKDSSEQPARSRKRAPVMDQQGANRTHDQAAWFGAEYDRASKSTCPIRSLGSPRELTSRID